MKTVTQRVNETINVIRNAPDLTPAVRGHIATWINAQFPRLTPQDRQLYTQLSGSMSVKGSIPVKNQRGGDHDRELRRAIVLLWAAIGQAQNIGIALPQAQQAMTMGTGQLGNAFSQAMLKAAVVAHPAGAQYVFQQLDSHPAVFIAAHRIIIIGTPAGSDRFSNAPTGNYQNVLGFHFQYDAAQDTFVLGRNLNGQYGSSHAFNTVSVPAVHWSQVPGVAPPPPYNFAGLLGCELAGATFMVTTQFTGCAFSWTDHGGVARASHVSPFGGGPGAYPGGSIALSQQIVANGAMTNAGNTAVTVFGAGAGNAPVPGGGNSFYPDPVVTPLMRVSIFGLDRGGAWRFYAQVIGNVNQILEARRIR